MVEPHLVQQALRGGHWLSPEAEVTESIPRVSVGECGRVRAALTRKPTMILACAFGIAALQHVLVAWKSVRYLQVA